MVIFSRKFKELLSAFSRTNQRASEIDGLYKESLVKLEEVRKYYHFIIAEKRDIKRMIDEVGYGQPWLSNAIAEYYELRDTHIEEYLKKKSHPAHSSAEIVKYIKKEKRELTAKLKEAEYKIAYYEGLFPELTDITNETVIELSETEELVAVDAVRNFLNDDEYKKLSTTERNQLALDRYLKRSHSKGHIGKMYERYIGYLYEQQMYNVEYFGIKRKLKDLGRDLVCEKSEEIQIVQCKYWSKSKEIHENTICQLYGTAVKYRIEHKLSHTPTLFDAKVVPVFISNINLSSVAMEFAKALEVRVIKVDFDKNYPIIKCNINKGQKIYHLPFDQQYDNVRIDPPAELYVKTIVEAESLGFRRAKRWIADKSK